ncbi:MAG: signal peptidase II [Cyanobacteriota bacterium]
MTGAGFLSASTARRLAWGVAITVVVVDQASKAWVTSHLQPGLSHPFLPGLFALRPLRNTGAAFSLFSGSTTVLALMSLLVSVAVALWISRLQRVSIWRALGAALVLGGAFGNGLDRWRLGAVVDFLAFLPFEFPVFNLADVAINLAVLCLAIDLFQPHGSAAE